MKKIEAVIRRERYEEVRAALEGVGYPGMMVTEIQGHGTQKGVQLRQGKEYKIGLIKKLKLEIVCSDRAVPRLIRTIADAARTGNVGDGKIFVSPIEQAVRIRSGESGEEALEAAENAVAAMG
jgi:nitrogen regulatory protein P-II 1